MSQTFKGRSILPATVEGQALVTRRGFNTLACFYKSILTHASTAVCGDQDNPELFGRVLTAKIICLPKSIGSTSAGATWDFVAKMGIAPAAMLFSEPIDSLSAAGLILADIWVGRRICTVDQLGAEFLAAVQTGQPLKIMTDGTVTFV